MSKIIQLNWFWLFLATCLLLFSSTLFASWVLMVAIWFGLFFIFRFTKLELNLLGQESNIYLNTVWFYPVAETFVKWMLMNSIIPTSWWWVNRIEHFSWAIAVSIIFLPTYTHIWKNFKWWQSMCFLMALICLIGNLNEFFEYYLRLPSQNNPKLFANYYSDTIYDMMVNIAGSFVGFLILKWNAKIATN